jgi:imidazole glycerol-phosphate synthase subunit HisF
VLKKRVIFTLLYDNGSFMLSRNFRLQKVGDLQWLKKNYNFSHISFFIDELIILDVTRSGRDEEKFYEHVRSLSEECFIPIAAGGGIRTLEQARRLLRSGADKVVINTLLAENSSVITKISKEFGSQCIVASLDVSLVGGKFIVLTNNGKVQWKSSINEALENLARMPIGELYLNSIDRDGTGHGYQIELLECIPNTFPLPVILAGGAGKYEHLSSGLAHKKVDAVATAHLFNFIGNSLKEFRIKLIDEGHNLACFGTRELFQYFKHH